MAERNPDAVEMEQAEGSRETVNANLDTEDPAQERYKGAQRGRDAETTGGGITNRPLSREIEEQEQLPPRGESKDEDEDRS
jgi:hypothetical protein